MAKTYRAKPTAPPASLEDRMTLAEAELRNLQLLIGASNFSNAEMYLARVNNEGRFYELQEDWARRYGEFIPVGVAAELIHVTEGCIHNWARDGKIVKSEHGGVSTRSLAAYIEAGMPHHKKEKAKAAAAAYAESSPTRKKRVKTRSA